MTFREQLALIRNGMAEKTTGPKPKKRIKPISDKKAAEMKEEKEKRGGEDTDLVKWYKSIMRYMTVCEMTGIRVENKIYRYAICSICHILPKSTCKSVATHPCNRIILLPDLHTKFDAMSWKEREQLACWPEIQQRLIMMYPDLDPSERRHFPESVLKIIQNNEPFQL